MPLKEVDVVVSSREDEWASSELSGGPMHHSNTSIRTRPLNPSQEILESVINSGPWSSPSIGGMKEKEASRVAES